MRSALTPSICKHLCARGRIALSGGNLRSPGRSAVQNFDLLRERAENRGGPVCRQPWRLAAGLPARLGRYIRPNVPLLQRSGLRSFRRRAVFRPSRRCRREGRCDLLRWRFDRRSRDRAKWPSWAPSPYADRPPARGSRAQLCGSPISAMPSFLIQTAGPQYPARPGLVEAGIAVPLYRSEAGQRSGHRHRRSAADRRGAGLARPLRSSRRRHAVAARSRPPPARDHAAWQRYDHAQSRSRHRCRGLRLGGTGRYRCRVAVTLVPRGIGRRAICPIATCRSGRRS